VLFHFSIFIRFELHM